MIKQVGNNIYIRRWFRWYALKDEQALRIEFQKKVKPEQKS